MDDPFLKNDTCTAKATTYSVLEKLIPERFIVPERTWRGRRTFCLIPGLSRQSGTSGHPKREVESSFQSVTVAVRCILQPLLMIELLVCLVASGDESIG